MEHHAVNRDQALAVLGAALGAAGLVYGRKQRRKARAMSQAEIDSLIAAADTSLSLNDQCSEDLGAFAGWYVRHEAPPNDAKPWFWYLAAAGGPDYRYGGMRALRSTSGYAATEADAKADMETAKAALVEAPPQENPNT